MSVTNQSNSKNVSANEGREDPTDRCCRMESASPTGEDLSLELPSCYTLEGGGADGDGTPIFYPNKEEFKDFSNYIRLIENTKAHEKSGIAKIVPPQGWHPRPDHVKQNIANPYFDVDDIIINDPVRERIEGARGVYTKYNQVYKKHMSIGDYKKLALSDKYKPPISPDSDWKDIEKEYWRTTTMREPIYGADTEGSLYENQVEEWNVTKLNTILDLIDENDVKIKGVNTAYLYLGMWKTTFPWHVEDMDLYSINYVHYGAPKFWYGIAEKHADRMEQLCASFFPESHRHCKQFLRHKMNLLSPHILQKHGIPFTKCICQPGEFMITFSRGFHSGFNVGYNCAESTNFATPRWVMIGANAQLCQCRADIVRIDMRPFVKKYRPYEYDEWHKYWYEETILNVMLADNDDEAADAERPKSADAGNSHREKASQLKAHNLKKRRKKPPPVAPILKLPRMKGETTSFDHFNADGSPIKQEDIVDISSAKKRAPVYEARTILPPCPRHSQNAALKEEATKDCKPFLGERAVPCLSTAMQERPSIEATTVTHTSSSNKRETGAFKRAKFYKYLEDGGLYKNLRTDIDKYRFFMNRLILYMPDTAVDAELVRVYNSMLGITEPHCAICQFFILPQHAREKDDRFAPVKRQWNELHAKTIPWRSRCFTNEATFIKQPEAVASLKLRRQKIREEIPRLKAIEDGFKPIILCPDKNEKMPDSFMSDDYRARMEKRLAKKLVEKIEDEEVLNLPHRWLVTCVDCSVTVHADCYNVCAYDLTEASLTAFWRCNLCKKVREDCLKDQLNDDMDEDDFDVMPSMVGTRRYSCKLCRTRGGALVGVNDGQSWVHVICAIFATNTVRLYDDPNVSGWSVAYVGPERNFNIEPNYDRRYYIVQETIQPPPQLQQYDENVDRVYVHELKRLSDLPCQPDEHGIWPVREMPSFIKSERSCYLCQPHHEAADGVTVPCTTCPADEAEYMHVTCAQHAGVTFHIKDFPKMIRATCNQHFAQSRLRKIYEGERVTIIRNPDDYPQLEKIQVDTGLVLKTKTIKYASVDFLDGDRSEDSHLSDIYACNCRKVLGVSCQGRHVINAKVKLRWKKLNEEHLGRLTGVHAKTYFQVLLDRNSEKVRVQREHLYGDDEPIPDLVHKSAGNENLNMPNKSQPSGISVSNMGTGSRPLSDSEMKSTIDMVKQHVEAQRDKTY